MKNILKQVFLKLRRMSQILIFFQQSRYAKGEELAQLERKVIDRYFIKKIFQFRQDPVLVMKYRKKF